MEIQIDGDDYEVRLSREQFLLLAATLDEHLLQFGDQFDVNGWGRREAQEFSVELAQRTRVARLGGEDAQRRDEPWTGLIVAPDNPSRHGLDPRNIGTTLCGRVTTTLVTTRLESFFGTQFDDCPTCAERLIDNHY